MVGREEGVAPLLKVVFLSVVQGGQGNGTANGRVSTGEGREGPEDGVWTVAGC